MPTLIAPNIEETWQTWENITSSSSTGSAIGASIGTIFPVIGTAIGTIIGSIVGLFAGFSKGSKASQAYNTVEQIIPPLWEQIWGVSDIPKGIFIKGMNLTSFVIMLSKWNRPHAPWEDDSMLPYYVAMGYFVQYFKNNYLENFAIQDVTKDDIDEYIDFVLPYLLGISEIPKTLAANKYCENQIDLANTLMQENLARRTAVFGRPDIIVGKLMNKSEWLEYLKQYAFSIEDKLPEFWSRAAYEILFDSLSQNPHFPTKYTSTVLSKSVPILQADFSYIYNEITLNKFSIDTDWKQPPVTPGYRLPKKDERPKGWDEDEWKKQIDNEFEKKFEIWLDTESVRQYYEGGDENGNGTKNKNLLPLIGIGILIFFLMRR